MANISFNQYDATIQYATFTGLMQYGGGINMDLRYATDEKNMETFGGLLQPSAACTLMVPELPEPIETLARLHRRWHTASDEKDLLVAASGGKLYAMLPTASEWTELAFPDGITEYQSNVWSWVTYEINPPGSTASIDVLLLSNALDGMVMVHGDNLAVTVVNTPKKFGIIERYAERIWGGAITDDPDMLVYSAPYDPTDWTLRDPDAKETDQAVIDGDVIIGEPEDGAGDINQPSWDGDSFTALRSFGSQLIAFKKTRVWRILGTDPGEYAFKEQFGGGAPYENTIAVDVERIFMLTDSGVVVYNGASVAPFQQEYCDGIFRRMNKDALNKATACLWHDKYYIAVPLDESEINNAVLIFDTKEGSWLYRDDVYAESFLPTEQCLYFTSSTTPGKVWQWQENSWVTGTPTEATSRWVSSWQDLGAKNIVKGGFEIYFLAEVKDTPVTLKFTVQTEKKSKTKKYTVKPNEKEYRQKRLHFGGSGRRFRLIIECNNEGAWRLLSGLQMIAEIDSD